MEFGHRVGAFVRNTATTRYRACKSTYNGPAHTVRWLENAGDIAGESIGILQEYCVSFANCCCISAAAFPPGKFYFSLRHQWFQSGGCSAVSLRGGDGNANPGGGGVFQTKLTLFVSKGEKSPNGMPLRREREVVSDPFRLERARRRPDPPRELLSGRSHLKWGELLYISGGISPWTTLLFPEASSVSPVEAAA